MMIFRLSLAVIVLFYFIVKFVRIVRIMRKPALLPRTEEERKAIRIHPEKVIQFPTYPGQKKGMRWYIVFLIFIMIVLVIGAIVQGITWLLYLYLTFMIFYGANHFLNLFAIMQDGILSGKGFTPWHRIKSYQIKMIDINHRYYGFSKDVNHRYELSIKTKMTTIRCMITNEFVKKRVVAYLEKNMNR